jgi:hypothetical protein
MVHKYSEFPGVRFTRPADGFIRVQATYHNLFGDRIEVDQTVLAKNEESAYNQVFGQPKEESKPCTCPHLALLRES